MNFLMLDVKIFKKMSFQMEIRPAKVRKIVR
jgi:hypothetical protein